MSFYPMPDSRRMLRVCLGLIGAVLGVFALFPGLDPAVSALFWDGTSFPVYSMAWVEALRDGLWNVALLVFGLSLLFMLRSAVTARPVLDVPVQVWAFCTAVFVAGPGVLVNVLLKEHWGRARPFQTTLFGGDAHFTPPWQITDQCARNCSFVSGEVAGATALAIVICVLVWHWRARLSPVLIRAVLILSPLLPALSALQRIAAGRHFLSDALLAMLFTATLALILYPALVLRAGPRRVLLQWGAGLHRLLLGRDRA